MIEPTGYTSLGFIGYSDKGSYDSSETYVKNDVVHHNGTAWLCKLDDTTGVTPEEGTNWRVFIEGAAPFEGATAQADGASGEVPKPLAGEQNKYLKGDGDWAIPSADDVSFDDTEAGLGENKVQGAIEKLASMIYPVGSIYMSVNNVNPSTYFGGTWVAWGSGRVPVGVSTDTEFNAVEKTGGDKSQTPTFTGTNKSLSHSGGAVQNHTLTVNEMPSHNHGGNTGNTNPVSSNNTLRVLSGNANFSFAYGSWGYEEANPVHSHTIPAQGGGAGHSHGFTQPSAHSYTPEGSVSSVSHLQPYITCYMWKRTA